jgi:hypothetical protein
MKIMSNQISKWTEEQEGSSEKRMNIIGQNGNDGLHYQHEAKPGDQLEFNFPKED